MLVTNTGCNKIWNALAVLGQKQATGKLIIDNGEQQWQIYFCRGLMLYATGGLHQTRRWYRAISQYCQHLKFNASLLSNEELWEYQLLKQGITQEQITLEEGKAIIRNSSYEILFSLASQPVLNLNWHSYQKLTSEIVANLALSPPELKQILEGSQKLWERWDKMGITDIFPEQAPIVKKSVKLQTRLSTASLEAITNQFNGQNTLWDIAVQKKQCLALTTRTLYHFFKQGLIEVRALPDLPSPLEQLQLVYSSTNHSRLPIACIDSTPITGNFLEQILMPKGYKIEKITDPMEGIGLMAKNPPELIFMDLDIPNVNGYALCNFLRTAPAYKETPIIIYTAQDSWINRVRAQVAGATDFLRKPANAKKILEIVEKYLKSKKQQSKSKTNLVTSQSLVLAR
ncbi:MAG: response regulator [Okeania sp. SIO2F4]|uniref:response regulator n=1 Tax=Okeania sp. SIO2F4 TaxID=2607790 RepID=UPI00142C725D|nr:response regulator [Okeania sp. SIO2F4]NES07904.1 response regulator [Okeania sp. SIO2F4]